MEEMKQLQELYSLKRSLDKNNLSAYVKEASKIQEEVDRIIITYQPEIVSRPVETVSRTEEKQPANQQTNMLANQQTNILASAPPIELTASAPPINPEYNTGLSSAGLSGVTSTNTVSSNDIIDDKIYQYEAISDPNHSVPFETVIQYTDCLKYVSSYTGGEPGWKSMIQMIASYESIEKNRDLVSIYYTRNNSKKKIDVVLVFKHITNSCRKLFNTSGNLIHVIEDLKCNESNDECDLQAFNYDVYGS